MSSYPVQAQSFTVYSPGATLGDTTLTLSSFNGIDGNPLLMAYFGSIGYGVLEPSSGPQEETISFTGITTNINGTVTLTGISSVGFVTPFTSTSGLSQSHAGGVTFIITNASAFYQNFANKTNNEVITGIWTFNNVPASLNLPVGLQDLANKAYVDSVVSGGTITTDQLIVNAVSGETIASGNLVYLKATDSRWYKTNATDATTLNNVILGIAQGAGTAGNAVVGGVLIAGYDTKQTGIASGTTYFASNTPGAIATSAGTIPKIVGIGGNISSRLFFNPTYAYTPTSNEKNALVGTSGSPSATNKFVTQESEFNSDTDQTQTVQDSSTIVGAANTTTNRNRVAQSYIAGRINTRGVELYKTVDTGTFTGTVTIALQADTAGSPSGTNLASQTITNAQWLLIAVGAFQIGYTAEFAQTIGTTYWVVVSTSTSDTSNHPNLGINSAGGYANGQLKYNNTTDGWVTTTTDLYFKTLNGIIAQVATGDSTGLAPNGVLPYGFLDLNITPQTISTTTETTVFTKVLPPGSLHANSGLRLEGFFEGAYSNTNSGGFQIVRVKINGNAILALQPSQVDTNSAPIYTRWTALIKNNNSLLSQTFLAGINGTSNGSISATPALTGAIAAYGGDASGTTSIDTSGLNILTVTIQNTEATTSFTHRWAYAEKIG